MVTDQVRPWAHLPNAQHIDRILSGVEQHHQVWCTVPVEQSSARSKAWVAAWDEWGLIGDPARNAVWYAERGAVQIAALPAARGAILALIAWDDAGDILDMPPDAIRLLAASGHNPAVLLLPAAVALSATI